MSPASTGGGKQQTFSVAGDNPPLSYMMHTRAERKMLPFRQPARGAAARSASLERLKINVIGYGLVPFYLLQGSLHFYCDRRN